LHALSFNVMNQEIADVVENRSLLGIHDLHMGTSRDRCNALLDHFVSLVVERLDLVHQRLRSNGLEIILLEI